MRSRSSAAQHDAAVARRLELLTTELATVREQGPSSETSERPAASWRPQGHTRIRAVPDLDDETDDDSRAEELDEQAGPVEGPGPAPSPVRLPGRHASRRRMASWAELVPEGLRGRILLGPGQVTVVAVLVAAGLGLTCWWLVRSGSHEEAAPLTVSPVSATHGALTTPAPPGGSAVPAVGAASPAASVPAKVVVDVTGKVRHPGIAVLRQGARVVDALRAAGGARPGVDLDGLNLARVLTDGEQIVVGGSPAGQAGPGPTDGPSASGSPVTGLVDLNTADQTTLESLPEVGPVTATAIIAWRTQHGGFTSVDQLLDVDGIGDATLAQLTPFVTI
jgi:competence protein ComEA